MGKHDRLEYRPDIDGLRAAAIIMVVVFHAFPRLFPGGFVGVDVFFVVSGYLITRLIVTDLDADRFSFAEFYFRRIRRIFPALVVVLAVTLAVGTSILLPSELASLKNNAIASALSGLNLFLIWETGYFDIKAQLKPLLHLWSLGIEEQFYLVWPVTLWLTPRRWRTAVIVTAIAVSLAACIVLTRNNPDAAFYLPFTRAWELLTGAALVGVRIENRAMKEALLILAVVSTAITIPLYNSNLPYPSWAAILPVAGTAAAITAGSHLLNGLILSNRVAIFIGRISYPIYLWHWPLFVFARVYLFRPLSTVETLLLIAITVALAWLTYEFIERPIRAGRAGGAKTAVAGMAAVVFCAFMAPRLQSPMPQEIAALVDVHPGAPEWQIGRCLLTDISKDFAPDCVEARRPMIAVIGDSTAGALMPGLRQLQAHENFGLTQFAVSSCQPILVHGFAMSDACVSRNREIVELLAKVRPDTVILQALWVLAPDELRSMTDALRSRGIKRIVVIGRVPHWKGGLPNIVAAYHRRTGMLLPERTSMFVEPEERDDLLLKNMSEATGAEYISAYKSFCDTSGCLNRIGNQLVASDGIHLTPAGSKYLIEHIAHAILDLRP